MNPFITIALLILAVATPSSCDKILVISDNANVETTHSQFLSMLKKSHEVDIAYSFGSQKIQLKKYDRFNYQHVIVMSLSSKESSSQIKVEQIISFFDEGGNVIVVGDIDTSKSNRKLFHAFGVELDQYGSKLKDHFNNHNNKVDILKTSNFVGQPFIYTQKPLLYRGVGMNLVNYENYQLYELVSSEPTSISRNYITQETTKVGRSSLIVGVQGLNNARAVILGSLSFLSDEFLTESSVGNEEAVQDLLAWTFQQTGIIRAGKMFYHGEGGSTKETVYNVGEKIYFQAEVETLEAGTQWRPLSTGDLQVEFVMLDPWVRIPIHQVNGTAIYKAQFYAPMKEGIYQFKIIYKKPGYTFLSLAQRVTVRPYKHDEYERFLFVAFPYTFGMLATIGGTFVFMTVFLYSKFKQEHLKKQ